MNIHKWGPPQHQEALVDGVVMVSSSGHGGMVLSPERNQAVPAAARAPDGCYEEDAAWAIAWTALRKAGVLDDGVRPGGRDPADLDRLAETTLDRRYPDHVRALLGRDPDPESPVLLGRRDHAEAREKGLFIAVSAIAASDDNAVPEGMVGAVLAPIHPSLDEPRRARAFHVLIDADAYGASRRPSGLRLFGEDDIIRVADDPWLRPEKDMISSAEAYGIASQWGSYMSDGDPGAVFYSLAADDARPSDFEHRRALLAYTRLCQGIAQDRIAEFEAASPQRRADWPWGDPEKDLEALRRLEDFFLRCAPLPAPEMDGPAP